MSELDDWIITVKDALGLTEEIDRDLVLDLARDVAHGVARPAAPLTAYLVGLAVAHGADPRDAVTTVTQLAQHRAPD